MRFQTFALLIALSLSITSACSMIDNYTGEDVNKQVRENGIPASAKVLEIWDTGVRLNNNPVVGFRLLVTSGRWNVVRGRSKERRICGSHPAGAARRRAAGQGQPGEPATRCSRYLR